MEGGKWDPVLVAFNEAIGEQSVRAAGQNGVGSDGEVQWFLQDVAA